MGLWRVAMDEATGRPTGSPESVSGGAEAAMELPSLSRDRRTLLFRAELVSINPAAIAFDPAAERAGEVRVLTARTGLLLPWSVSPDGEWLALNNFGERQEDLFLVRRDGTGLRRLTDDPARDRAPRWTPDGQALVFYSNRDGQFQTWSIRPDGSGLTMLQQEPTYGLVYGAISPADGRLSATYDRGSGAVLATPPFPATGDRLRTLPFTGADGGFFAPSMWSPDGKWLSGSWNNDARAPVGVAVHEVATGRTYRVGDHANVYAAPFLPDSRRIVYMASDGQLVVVDVPGGLRRRVPLSLPLPTGPEPITIAPDGRTIYYGAQRIESNVWKVERR